MPFSTDEPIAFGQVWRKKGSIYMAISPITDHSRAWGMLLIGRLDPIWGDGKPLFRMGASEHVTLPNRADLGWERIA